MAYNDEHEVREELGMFRKNNRGDHLGVVKITDTKKDTVAFDIRNLYTDDNDELRFTAKGVRVNDEMAVDMVKALLKGFNEDQIQDILIDYQDSTGDYLEEDFEEEDFEEEDFEEEAEED